MCVLCVWCVWCVCVCAVCEMRVPRCSLCYTSTYYYVRYVYFLNDVTYVPIFQARAQKKFFVKKLDT